MTKREEETKQLIERLKCGSSEFLYNWKILELLGSIAISLAIIVDEIRGCKK